MKTVIQNGLVANHECTAFLPLDILVDGEKIERLMPHGAPVPQDANVLRADGLYVLPGLIDTHIHGCVGEYFGTECAEDPTFRKALIYCAKQGVTTVLPTISVRPMQELLSGIEAVLAAQQENCGSRIGGIHLEGPFISAVKKGAMNVPEIPCTEENFLTLLNACQGQLRTMTIAPERENALAVIARGRQEGVRMSIGHTDATYEQALAAVQAGATGSTHTFNAMRSLAHRDPGVLGAVLTEPDVVCEAICDMIHLSPATVRLIFAAKGTDRVIMISDSVKSAGLGDGAFQVDGKTRFVKGGVSRLADGTIAGSNCSMSYGASRLAELGVPLLDIAKAGSLNPARATGLADRGRIQEGLLADLLLVDQKMNISAILLRGEALEREC